MKLSDVLSCFDGTPLSKYGAKVHLDVDKIYIESAICTAEFGPLENVLPSGVYVQFDALKTAIKHMDNCIFSIKEDGKMLLRGKGYKLTLSVIQEQPPDIQAEDFGTQFLEMNSDLADKIDKCLPYTSKDSSRADLCSVHVRNGKVEATNRTAFISIDAGQTTPNIAFYNTIITPIILGLAKLGPLQIWSGEKNIMVQRQGVFCLIPHMAKIDDIPTIEKVLENTCGEPIQVDMPLGSILSEIKTITTICSELAGADDTAILLTIAPGKFVVDTTDPKFKLTKIIPYSHKNPEFSIQIPRHLAADLPDFMPEKSTVELTKIHEDMYLLSLLSNTIKFYSPVTVI